ncbi:MAG: hypothetical protein PSX71_04445 [bacterium]|nr:hypothetical protein [bacterium]
MMKPFCIVMLCTLTSGVALAAPAPKTAKPAAQATASPATADATQTDVIGSKEAPSVFNIVPWKDKAAVIPKKEVSTSILRETLQPLDRDILRREIQLQQSLSKD